MDYYGESVFPGGNVVQVLAGNYGNVVGGGNWGCWWNDPGMWTAEGGNRIWGRESAFPGENVVQVLAGDSRNGVGDGNLGCRSSDPCIWATEDGYRVWSKESAFPGENVVQVLAGDSGNGVGGGNSSSGDVSLSKSASGGEPPLKKSRSFHMEGVTGDSRSKAIGKMFYKTRLCNNFLAGTCPSTQCHYAHGIEELRQPPPNWEEIVAAHEEDRAVSMEPRKEFQIPSLVAGVESSRSYKGHHCKKFYTEEGCPYGDSCTFLHDEQSKSRESDAISLGPGPGGGYSNIPTAASYLNTSNWKTRICNKWEMTGYCQYGTKCYFAHGTEELHNFAEVPRESELAKAPTKAKSLEASASSTVSEAIMSLLCKAVVNEVSKAAGDTSKAVKEADSLVSLQQLEIDSLQKQLEASINSNLISQQKLEIDELKKQLEASILARSQLVKKVISVQAEKKLLAEKTKLLTFEGQLDLLKTFFNKVVKTKAFESFFVKMVGYGEEMGQNELAEKVLDSIPDGRKFDALQKQKKKEISDRTCTAWFDAIKDDGIVLPFLDHIASLGTVLTPQELKAIEYDESETWKTYCNSSS